MTREISVSIEVSPNEVDAGADLTVKGKVSCSPAVDLRGKTLIIKDQDGTLVQSIELTEFDGNISGTRECVVKSPGRPGGYSWMAVCPADAGTGISHDETSVEFSFTVKPHSTRVVAWDAPPAIECGERFSLKLGVKCSSECLPEGWELEVYDHDGKKQTTVTLSADTWPGSAALYYAEVDLQAPDAEGLYAWEARAPGPGPVIPHAEGSAGFGVRVVPVPECVLTVLAIDKDSQTPVKDAQVVVHPYRAFTDERGVAEVRLPKGEYRLFVSGGDYFPFRSCGEAKSDMTIRAELAVDRGPSDADVWS